MSAIQVFQKLLEKEKLLVMSNFSFSHSVFYPFGKLSTIVVKCEIVVCKHFKFARVENLLFGNGLKHDPNFKQPWERSFSKTRLEKEKMLTFPT